MTTCSAVAVIGSAPDQSEVQVRASAEYSKCVVPAASRICNQAIEAAEYAVDASTEYLPATRRSARSFPSDTMRVSESVPPELTACRHAWVLPARAPADTSRAVTCESVRSYTASDLMPEYSALCATPLRVTMPPARVTLP